MKEVVEILGPQVNLPVAGKVQFGVGSRVGHGVQMRDFAEFGASRCLLQTWLMEMGGR